MVVRFFSMSCKPTKANGGRTRNRPEDAPEKWERFKTYCIRDVDAEREIRQKLWKFPIPESEMELYRMDQEINDRGILVDGISGVEEICQIMSEQPDWAAGLPLRADGYECAFYKKD